MVEKIVKFLMFIGVMILLLMKCLGPVENNRKEIRWHKNLYINDLLSHTERVYIEVDEQNDSIVFYMMRYSAITSSEIDSLADIFKEKLQLVSKLHKRFNSLDNSEIVACSELYEEEIKKVCQLFTTYGFWLKDFEQLVDSYKQKKRDRVMLSRINEKLDTMIRKENELFYYYKLKRSKIAALAMVNYYFLHTILYKKKHPKFRSSTQRLSVFDSLDITFCYEPFVYEYVAAESRFLLSPPKDGGSSYANKNFKKYILKRWLE